MARVETVSRGFGSPMRYIQGPGELENLVDYVAVYGKKACALIDSFLFDDTKKVLDKNFSEKGLELLAIKFSGECTEEEAERVANISKDFSANVLVGVGSGKTLDTIKASAEFLNLPRIIVPTSIASDAATSSLTIFYTKEGVHDKAVRHKRGTDLVLIDSSIIVKAPVRLLVAGLGDALSTVFEAHANAQSDAANCIGKGYRSCKAAIAIAELCFEIIMADGIKAKRDVERGLCTEAVENIIEANTLLSGLGFENTGCCTAHGIHAGLSEIPETHSILHGEKVAFGVICQMILENTPVELVDRIMRFLIEVGLPTTLEDMKIKNTEENINIITNKVFNNNPYVHNEPFKVTYQQVHDAIISADLLGESYN